jgi:2-dehydropantoate 2-reductase
MKIAVVGAGGTGGYFGGRLAAAGHDVVFVARGEHLEALRREGLAVQSVAGDFTVAPVLATDDPGELGPVDAVLLCVKTWQLTDALAALSPLLGAATAVVTMQNGVEAPDQVADAVGRERVLPGIAKIFAMVDGPGRISHSGGPASLAFGEFDNRPSERVDGLREALRGSGVAVEAPADIWAALWAKFLFVVPLGGLGAATDTPVGALRTRPGARSLLADAMREVEQLARARGIGLPADIVDTSLTFVDGQPEEATSSLHRDLRVGRRSELDAWTGAVVRLAAESGTPAPVNRTVYEVLAARSRSDLG